MSAPFLSKHPLKRYRGREIGGRPIKGTYASQSANIVSAIDVSASKVQSPSLCFWFPVPSRALKVDRAKFAQVLFSLPRTYYPTLVFFVQPGITVADGVLMLIGESVTNMSYCHADL